MSRFKTLRTTIATLSVAVAIGLIVQQGEQQYTESNRAAATAAEDAIKAPRILMMATNAQGDSVFGVPNTVVAPSDHSANVREVIAVDAVYAELNVPQMGEIQATYVAGCDVTLSAKRQTAAVVTLNIDAPCAENSELVVTHEALRFVTVTDGAGRAAVDVPVLTIDAEFSVSLNNIVHATTSIFAPELRQYDRAVVQWASADNMRLHAFEGNADIGDPGHVWSASIHSAQDVRDGTHGFVVYVGEQDATIPYQAEVYTFPAGQTSSENEVDLQIGVGVTEANCDREIYATIIQSNAGELVVESDISAKMPSCAQQGTIAFLENKFDELTLAAR